MKLKKIILSSSLLLIGCFSTFLVNVYFNKESVSNKALSNNSNTEVHNWNAPYYSLSEDELKRSLDNKINKVKGSTIVVLYDGGRCNAYIENVLSEVCNLSSKYNKVLVTNYNQSYIDSMYGDYSSSVLILGDENRYLSKELDLFDSEAERMRNVIMVYDKGELINKLEYTPRFEGSITNLIK